MKEGTSHSFRCSMHSKPYPKAHTRTKFSISQSPQSLRKDGHGSSLHADQVTWRGSDTEAGPSSFVAMTDT